MSTKLTAEEADKRRKLRREKQLTPGRGKITTENRTKFIESRLNNKKTKIDLSGLDLSPSDFKLISPILGHLGQKLDYLNLDKTIIGPIGIKYLAPELEKCTNIEVLGLENSRVGIEGSKLLAKALTKMTKLRVLHIEHAFWEDEGSSAIASALKKTPLLTELAILDNRMTAKGFKDFVTCLSHLPELDYLSLASNSFGDEGAALLAPILVKLTKMTSLTLDQTNLSHNGMKSLIEPLSKLGLTSLSLNNNPIGEKGANHLATALSSNTHGTLLSLSMSSTNIGAEGTASIATALPSHPRLARFDLSNSGIRSKGSSALVDSTTSLRNLKYCVFGGNVSSGNPSDIVFEDHIEITAPLLNKTRFPKLKEIEMPNTGLQPIDAPFIVALARTFPHVQWLIDGNAIGGDLKYELSNDLSSPKPLLPGVSKDIAGKTYPSRIETDPLEQIEGLQTRAAQIQDKLAFFLVSISFTQIASFPVLSDFLCQAPPPAFELPLTALVSVSDLLSWLDYPWKLSISCLATWLLTLVVVLPIGGGRTLGQSIAQWTDPSWINLHYPGKRKEEYSASGQRFYTAYIPKTLFTRSRAETLGQGLFILTSLLGIGATSYFALSILRTLLLAVQCDYSTDPPIWIPSTQDDWTATPSIECWTSSHLFPWAVPALVSLPFFLYLLWRLTQVGGSFTRTFKSSQKSKTVSVWSNSQDVLYIPPLDLQDPFNAPSRSQFHPSPFAPSFELALRLVVVVNVVLSVFAGEFQQAQAIGFVATSAVLVVASVVYKPYERKWAQRWTFGLACTTFIANSLSLLVAFNCAEEETLRDADRVNLLFVAYALSIPSLLVLPILFLCFSLLIFRNDMPVYFTPKHTGAQVKAALDKIASIDYSLKSDEVSTKKKPKLPAVAFKTKADEGKLIQPSSLRMPPNLQPKKIKDLAKQEDPNSSDKLLSEASVSEGDFDDDDDDDDNNDIVPLPSSAPIPTSKLVSQASVTSFGFDESLISTPTKDTIASTSQSLNSSNPSKSSSKNGTSLAEMFESSMEKAASVTKFRRPITAIYDESFISPLHNDDNDDGYGDGYDDSYDDEFSSSKSKTKKDNSDNNSDNGGGKHKRRASISRSRF